MRIRMCCYTVNQSIVLWLSTTFGSFKWFSCCFLMLSPYLVFMQRQCVGWKHWPTSWYLGFWSRIWPNDLLELWYYIINQVYSLFTAPTIPKYLWGSQRPKISIESNRIFDLCFCHSGSFFDQSNPSSPLPSLYDLAEGFWEILVMRRILGLFLERWSVARLYPDGLTKRVELQVSRECGTQSVTLPGPGHYEQDTLQKMEKWKPTIPGYWAKSWLQKQYKCIISSNHKMISKRP